jgi:outer membrane murein-binding lipoprotein Lpp
MLPRELTAVIHHIELNRAGWWDKAVQQLLIFVLWLKENKPLSMQEILDELKDQLGLTLDSARCREQLEQLEKAGKIAQFQNSFKLTESAFAEAQRLIEDAQRIEDDAKKQFATVVENLCPGLDPSQLWSDFNDKFLAPFVKDMGAHIFRLLTTGTQASEFRQLAKDYLTRFVSSYPQDRASALQEVILNFLNLRDQSVRSYVLRVMNSYFYVEALGVTEKDLQKLMELAGSRPIFKVFVDTNFLFSILNLHDNPSNEAAKALMDLRGRLHESVTLRFYVTPLTLDEAKRVIASQKSSLTGIRMTPNLVRGAQAARIMSGIQQRFIEACADNPSLDAESFFRPYVNDLLKIARLSGIELYNENLDDYKTKQEVVKDIWEQQRFEENLYGSDAKPYKALEHDIVLWHFVKGKRQSYLESPIEAEYWIVTIDYRFLAFDRYKTKNQQIAVCVHPTALIQMLQFWAPRTDMLEEALLASLRLPLFFSEFDPEAEKVAIKILQTLSRFENVEDIPADTVANILLSESLRAKMSATSQVEEQVELIREALIEEQNRLQRELEESKVRLQEKEKKTMEMEATIRDLNRKIEQETSSRKSVEHQLQQAQEEIAKLKERIKAKEDEEKRRLQEEERRRTLRSFLIWWNALPLVILILGLAVFKLALGWELPGLIFLGGIFLAVWLWVIDHQAKKKSIEHPIVKRVLELKRWIWGAITSIIIGITINALWDWIKALLNR